MKDTKIIADAIKFWLAKRQMNQLLLAKKLEASPSAISQWVSGVRNPSFDMLEQLAAAFDISLVEFLACRDDSMPEIEFVPLIKARPRAGNGGLETDGESEGHYSFHSSFLRRKGGSKESMCLFRIAGDSMQPTLSSGDMVMINQSERHVRSGEIYLLRIGEELMLKRLENRPGGLLLIKSDNPDYEPFEVRPAEAHEDEFAVYGRMVWSCREY